MILSFLAILSVVTCEWAHCETCDYEKPTVEAGFISWALMEAADVGVKAADVEGSKQPMCRTKAADVRPKAADVRSKQPMSGQSSRCRVKAADIRLKAADHLA